MTREETDPAPEVEPQTNSEQTDEDETSEATSTEPELGPRPDPQELARLLGEDLFAFMLAARPRDIASEIELDEARLAAIELIWDRAKSASERITDEYQRHRWTRLSPAQLIENFCTYEEFLKTTFATYSHIKSGGRNPDIPANRSLEAHLQIIAIDCFAARLIGDGGTITPGSAPNRIRSCRPCADSFETVLSP